MRAQFEVLLQDLRYALRQLRRSPGFAVVAILSLAIGIGANATIYSAAHAFLNQQPVAARPDEIVRVYRGEHSPLPRDWLLHFARNARTFRDMLGEDPAAVGVGRDDGTERAQAAVVTENFFDMLGVGAAEGAVFHGRAGEPIGPVVVLSHVYWETHFGSDPSVVGRVLRLNGQPFTVVGVSQAGFQSSQFAWFPDLFVPLAEQGRLMGVADSLLGGRSMYVTGRLAPGATRAQAESEILALAGTLPGATEEATRRGAFRVDHARGITAEVRMPITAVSGFLLLVVGVVLLIACANLANLLLARATGRRREIAVRSALGVSRGRLVRQLLTESLVVALMGGVAAFGLTSWLTRLIPRVVPPEAKMMFDLSPDWRVMLFTAVLAIGTGVLFGLAPALQASRADIQGVMKGAAAEPRRGSRLRAALLVSQVSLATALLVGAVLFIRSLGNAEKIDPGFVSDRVVDVAIDLSVRQYGEPEGHGYFRDLLDGVRAQSGVEAASLAALVPLGGSNMGTGIAPASTDPTDRRSFRSTNFNVVSPGYFEMFGMPMARGRAFDEGDREGTTRVVILNETLARQLWPAEEAVGQTVRFEGEEPMLVVGVARDAKYNSLGERGVAFTYLPSTQRYRDDMVLQARLASDTPGARAALAEVIRRFDPALPAPVVAGMDEDMRISLLPARAGAGLLGGFGLLALFLAAIGVYGVTAYLVGQRTVEVGIRAALGATPRDVLRLMMRQTLWLVGIGLAIGLAAGVGLGALASGWLYGVGPLDPITLLGAGALLLAVAGLGTWIPARRALAVDPLVALRRE